MTVTSDYVLSAVKGIKEVFKDGVQESLLKYMDSGAFAVYDSAAALDIYTTLESSTAVKELSDFETPPSYELGEGYQIQLEDKRFGASIEISERTYTIDAPDSTTYVDEYIMEQAAQAMRDVENQLVTNAHLFYNEAFSSTGTFLAPDGVELCGPHVWANGESFINEGTAAFSESALDAAMEVGAGMTDPSGKPRPVTYDTIVVRLGSDAARLARRLFAESISPVSYGDIRLYEGEFRIIETPYITYANRAYWFLRDSSFYNPLAIGISKMPSMNDPIKQNNEAIRSNITGFWKQGIIDMPFSLWGSNGTA